MKYLHLFMLFIALLGCSKQEDDGGNAMISGESEPYKLTITNGCKNADLLLWCESDYLKYNETSGVIEGYKDTADIALKWSDKEYGGNYPYWDTVTVVMKTNEEIYNFRIDR